MANVSKLIHKRGKRVEGFTAHIVAQTAHEFERLAKVFAHNDADAELEYRDGEFLIHTSAYHPPDPEPEVKKEPEAPTPEPQASKPEDVPPKEDTGDPNISGSAPSSETPAVPSA